MISNKYIRGLILDSSYADLIYENVFNVNKLIYFLFEFLKD